MDRKLNVHCTTEAEVESEERNFGDATLFWAQWMRLRVCKCVAFKFYGVDFNKHSPDAYSLAPTQY